MPRQVREIAVRLVILALLGMTAALPASPATAQEQELARIVAVVNDELISIHDLAARVRLTFATLGVPEAESERDRLIAEVFETLIDERLKVQAAKRMDVNIGGTEAEAAYARLAQNYGMTGDEFRQTLRQQGISEVTVWAKIDADLRWGRIIQGRAAVPPEDVEEEMADIRAAEDQPEYRIRRIVLLAHTEAERAAAREEAAQLQGDLLDGTDFRLTALRHSQGLPDSPGGDWVRGDAIDPALAAALSGLEEGEISGPIETPGAVYLVQLLARRAVTVPEDENVLRQQADQLVFRRNALAADRSLLRQLRASALIDRRL